MKLFFLSILFFCTTIAQASTLQEDYAELAPEMGLLNIGTGASLNLLQPYVEKGNSVALFLAASLYEEGRVVDKDDQKAFELYLKASDKNPLAQMAAANMYASGRGTKQSLPEALLLYSKVLKGEDESLKKEASIKIITLHDILVKQEAFTLLKTDALSGNPKAILNMSAYCLEQHNLICTYVWLSVALQMPELKESADDFQNDINKLSGEMTMSELTQAEEELIEISDLIKKIKANNLKNPLDKSTEASYK